MTSFLVFGATGATGKAVVKELLSPTRSGDVARVVTVGRRKLDDIASDGSLDGSKLDEVIVDSLDRMDDEVRARVMSGGPIDISLCCLGTTRSAAGSADAFRKVDVEYVDAAASLAKSCGTRVFGLVSAQGASKNIWASDWKPFHGLLYAKCKGLAEERVKNQGFDHTIIMRPGLLDRQEASRFGERLVKGILPCVRTDALARVMIHVSMSKCPPRSETVNSTTNTSHGDVSIFEMKEIQCLSRSMT